MGIRRVWRACDATVLCERYCASLLFPAKAWARNREENQSMITKHDSDRLILLTAGNIFCGVCYWCISIALTFSLNKRFEGVLIYREKMLMSYHVHLYILGVQLTMVLKGLNSQGEIKYTIHKLISWNKVYFFNFIESKDHKSGMERKHWPRDM